ncbi:hypothetical protein [Streptomyces hokutonensis]|uniref:hypothetical protein n=1 Tax=Streptomyces hokutonensis TaxID=1306990 RepID=UPI0033F59E94
MVSVRGWLECDDGQLARIARIPASYPDEEYDERPRGLFLVSHEVDGMSEWRVHNGGLVIGVPEGDYRYLDA